MHDLKYIRENPEAFEAAMQRRTPFFVGLILDLDQKIRGGLKELEDLQAERNAISKEIGQFKRKNEPVPDDLTQKVEWIKERLQVIDSNDVQNPNKLRAKLDSILAGIPNSPLEDVPIGADESKMSKSLAGENSAILISLRKITPTSARLWDWTLKQHKKFQGPASLI